ncbi:neprilysin-2-like [Harmonia axyridis]|uniref:neprilysin-2-like n=1 Tax=Harmonia axyridis TaxID=115357 RepID=UPI001E277CF7|nr:neprilysin-2-like [Harmonia axyridis]
MDYEPVRQDTIFRRKRRGRFVICGAILLVILLLVLALGIYAFIFRDKGVCETEECKDTSKKILGNMDLKADPCQDFYQFACGEFVKKAVIPSSRTEVDSFSTQADVIDKQIHTVLEEPYKKEDARTIQLVKQVYRACMNETDIELHSVNSIKKLLKSFGGWPVVEGSKWNEDTFNWSETLIKMKESGLPYGFFMDFSVVVDDKNSSRRILTVDQGFVAFEPIKRGPRDNPILDATHTFMVNIAEAFGADRNRANREMEDVLRFEMDIAKIMVRQEERRNLENEYNPVRIRDLERDFPILPWYNFINRLVYPSKVTRDTMLIIHLPVYLQRLKPLLDRTPKRLLANYILYKAAASLITYSNKRLRQIRLEFTKATVGIRSSSPRNEQCTSIASRLEVAAGALYVRKYFNKESKLDTEEIVKDVEEQFTKTLTTIDWMDQETKKAALEKLKNMDKYIAYPDELMDDSKLEEFYKNLQLTSDNYIEIVLNISKFQTEKEMMLLSEPVVRSDWRTRSAVAVVNAYYDTNANAIQVPAGILQGVFFNAKRPRYLNFGGIGYIIGHEFTHGFDDEGSQMDKDGNLKEWWKGTTKAAYEKKAKCIVNQYSNISVPEVGMKINGVNCQGENIADNGGIKLAYLAYQEWVNKNGAENKLPNLDYTPNQMFWIGAANVWCSKMQTKALEQVISTGVHPPDKYRINVPLANSKYFSKDFNCPKGSPMNPDDTCTVW